MGSALMVRFIFLALSKGVPISVPSFLVAGANGYYVADLTNNNVRRVTSSGVITTVCGQRVAGYSGNGGPATALGVSGGDW